MRSNDTKYLCAAFCIGLSCGLSLSAEPVRAAAVPAQPAYNFVNSVGLGTKFLRWAGSIYRARYTQLKAKLSELGIRHIRDEVTGSSGSIFQGFILYARRSCLDSRGGSKVRVLNNGSIQVRSNLISISSAPTSARRRSMALTARTRRIMKNVTMAIRDGRPTCANSRKHCIAQCVQIRHLRARWSSSRLSAAPTAICTTSAWAITQTLPMSATFISTLTGFLGKKARPGSMTARTTQCPAVLFGRPRAAGIRRPTLNTWIRSRCYDMCHERCLDLAPSAT